MIIWFTLLVVNHKLLISFSYYIIAVLSLSSFKPPLSLPPISSLTFFLTQPPLYILYPYTFGRATTYLTQRALRKWQPRALVSLVFWPTRDIFAKWKTITSIHVVAVTNSEPTHTNGVLGRAIWVHVRSRRAPRPPSVGFVPHPLTPARTVMVRLSRSTLIYKLVIHRKQVGSRQDGYELRLVWDVPGLLGWIFCF
jgi:hypothetical protein